MTIPEGFELEPVKAGSHPAPDIPTQQKADIYDDADIHFKTIDEHAIEVNVFESVSEFVSCSEQNTSAMKTVTMQ